MKNLLLLGAFILSSAAFSQDLRPDQDLFYDFFHEKSLTCGDYRDAEVSRGCRRVGCTKIVTAEQERISRNTMGRMMEQGHVNWHRRVDPQTAPNQSERLREAGGRSFFSMHANMLHAVQKVLYSSGRPCMPGLYRLPRRLEDFRSLAQRSSSNSIVPPLLDRNGRLVMERVVDRRTGRVVERPVEEGSVIKYNRAYTQWTPYSLENMRDSRGNLRLSWTRSLGIFGANVQHSFHNTLHMSLTELSKRDTNRDGRVDYRDTAIDDLRFSDFATRNAYFWLIHGLVDYQVNYYMFAHNDRMTRFENQNERNNYWNNETVDRRLYGGVLRADSQVTLMCHVMGNQRNGGTCNRENPFVQIPMRRMERSSPANGPVVVSSSEAEYQGNHGEHHSGKMNHMEMPQGSMFETIMGDLQ